MDRDSRAAPNRSALAGALVGIGIALVGFGLAADGLAAPTAECNATGTNTPCVFEPEDEEGSPIGSLKAVTKPVDAQLAPGGRFIRSQAALVQLGKALFWDQQVGSDGQACGSCHFTAGADGRTRNQISPGLKSTPPDSTFQLAGPNHLLTTTDFPIHELARPDAHNSRVVRDANDVVSSAGVFFREFRRIQDLQGLAAPRPAFDPRAADVCASKPDPNNFQVGGVNVRRVEPRNTPTMINAAFNNRNFWDSRAQDVFNGVNPFGARDPNAVVWEDANGPAASATRVQIRITFASLASQAVGPPVSEFEMSCLGREFPDIGHKLMTSTTTPLAQQDVSATDSALGPLSNAHLGRGGKGLAVSYADLVTQAFQPRWWESLRPVGSRPQIEANFSMFWGLAVQAYVETLKADDTRVDRFFDRTGSLSASELRGLNLFQSAFGTRPDAFNPTVRVSAKLFDGKTDADLRCTACHGGPETTAASIDAVRNDARLERMAMPNGGCAIYDAGHFNTGVRRTTDDFSLGASDPFGNPFGETQLAIAGTLQRLVPTAVPPFGLVPAMGGTVNCDGPNVNGTFKAPQLRNVELTGPYFHNGGQLTLRQVVDFYNRGGDFDNPDFDPNVHALRLETQDKEDLIAFLVALTDERVAFERAPFDHPSICVANGELGSETSVQVAPPLPGDGPAPRAADNVTCVPATGAEGRATRLTRFLGADPSNP